MVTLTGLSNLYGLAPGTLRRYRDEAGIDIHDPRQVFRQAMMADSSRIEVLGRLEFIIRNPELWPVPAEVAPPVRLFAERYGVTERTARRWKAAGVPLDNPAAVARHIATTRSPAPSAVEKALTHL